MELYPKVSDKDIQHKISHMLEYRLLENDQNLFPHQEFVRRYISPFTPYKYLIIFHGLGCGKTLASLKVVEDHYLYSGMRTVVITRGVLAEDTFKLQIKNFDIKCNVKYYRYISLANMIRNTATSELPKILSNA